MPAYAFNSESAWVAASGGGAVTPTMPAFTPGYLGVLFSGAANTSGQTVSDPAGWVRQSPVTITGPFNVEIAIWTRVLVGGDVGPTVQYSGSGYNSGKILTFSGDVYTDQTTIKDDSDASSTTNTNLLRVPPSTPTLDNDLLIYMGFRTKTATTNGATIGTVSGFSKSVLADTVPNGGGQAATVQYWQQTARTSVALGGCTYSIADSNLGTWGVIVALKTLGSAPVRKGGLMILGAG